MKPTPNFIVDTCNNETSLRLLNKSSMFSGSYHVILSVQFLYFLEPWNFIKTAVYKEQGRSKAKQKTTQKVVSFDLLKEPIHCHMNIIRRRYLTKWDE